MFKKIDFIPTNINQLAWDYVVKNDPAHNIGHIQNVLDMSLELISLYNFSLEEELALVLAAIYHDSGCWIDRKEHHIHSGVLARKMFLDNRGTVIQYKGGSILLDNLEELTVCAIEQHRSSFKGIRSKLGKFITIADTGVPSVTSVVERTVAYTVNTFLVSYKGDDKVSYLISNYRLIAEEAIGHIIMKYSSNGKRWESMPEEGLKLYVDPIRELRNLVDNYLEIHNLVMDKMHEVVNAFDK